MLGRCGLPTLPTKNIPPIRRAPRHNKHNAASNPHATFAGLKTSSRLQLSSDGSHASSIGRTSLPPSPTFRNCLLPSTPQASESVLLWQLSSLLKEKGDITRLSNALTGPDSPIQTPNGFNALFARLRYLQDFIPPIVVLEAMHCAAKDPIAMKTLLGLYYEIVTHSSSDQEQAHEPEYLPWFERIAKKILSFPNSQQGSSMEERTKSQWIWVLAGWDGGLSGQGKFPKPPSIRECCLFDLGPKKQHRCWPIYIEMLSMHGESRLLANEWEKFATEEIGTIKSSPNIAAAQIFRENLNATISALLRLGDPGRAWSIAYGAGDIIELVDYENLRSLLAHPDGLKSWRPEMNEAGLEMLDTEIQKIEQFLGLRWEGGEDGFHCVETASESKKLG